MKLCEQGRRIVHMIASFYTYKLGFVGWRSFGDGLELLDRDPLHILQGGSRVENNIFDKNAQSS